jgi:hypothetical protein
MGVHDLGHCRQGPLSDRSAVPSMEYPELKREQHAQYKRFRPSVVLIEDKPRSRS